MSDLRIPLVVVIDRAKMDRLRDELEEPMPAEEWEREYVAGILEEITGSWGYTIERAGTT